MMRFLILVLIITTISFALKDDYCERDENGACKKKTKLTCTDDDDEPCFYEETVPTKETITPGDEKYPLFSRLFRYDVQVGDVMEQTIDGHKLKVITRANKPLLFEIPDALTEDEIFHLKEKVTSPYHSEGLFKSEARGGLTPKDTFKPSSAVGKAYGPAGGFSNWDLNDDGKIDLKEVEYFCRNYNFLYFKSEDINAMFSALNIKEFDDGEVNEEEFKGMNTLGIEDYLNRAMREHPKHRQRTSEQTWLPMAIEFDPVLAKIRERFGKLFKIPERILLGSEHLQIVRYTPGGHYHAHHDTETHKATESPCCHHTSTKTISKHAQCRLCRFMTIMFYLEAPEEGGETAFPAADNITYDDAAFRRHGNPAVDLYNLSEHCYDANLVLKATKGTAVAWYNHHVDPESGWLGALDDWSLHGGCEVRKGEKWIANLWITAPYKDDVDKLSMYSIEYMETMRESNL